ncbi:hypothetical protein Pint_14260 [Pistacia integerrima]|uniref:Uncharacterized protein n=1 Tax=Pistacia integerrima TaxID=434235 RepID=A0ACC0Y9M7_9ROSI|nr:hypothetical protein Pint_14260 [Pistacia integerrima]
MEKTISYFALRNCLLCLLHVPCISSSASYHNEFSNLLLVSVLEESYGIDPSAKAAKIVKGMEMHGFLVNLVMTMLSFIVLQGFNFLKFKDFAAVEVIIGLLIWNSHWLVKMFGLDGIYSFVLSVQENSWR